MTLNVLDNNNNNNNSLNIVGGYNVANTASCWTLLTATALNVKLPTDIPDHKVINTSQYTALQFRFGICLSSFYSGYFSGFATWGCQPTIGVPSLLPFPFPLSPLPLSSYPPFPLPLP